jgi:hypothetical protein
MEPNNDRTHGGSGRQLRRYGPLIAIVVIAAVVGAVVLFTGGGDDDEATTTGGKVAAPKGAISWSEAKEKNLDVEFEASCDTKTGRIAMPYFYRPECYANVADNGGATSQGVTRDTIKVVVYLNAETDPILDYITSAIRNDDTTEQVKQTFRDFDEIFGSLYQTYGRKVEIEFVQGTGTIIDEVAARADAQKAIDKKPFAVWGSPPATAAWADELAANKIICLSCFGGGFGEWWEERSPYAISVLPGLEQGTLFFADYVVKRLAGRKAEHAGDPALQRQERKFGSIYLDQGEESQKLSELFEDTLAKNDVELTEHVGYNPDPSRLQEQAAVTISRLKSAGVTTVFFTGDPIAPRTYTEEATRQEFFPEWVITGTILTDTAAFGRTYDQRQWAHAFGISYIPARVRSDEGDAIWRLHEWYHGKPPAAKDTYGVLWFMPATFYAALQAAGPNLTPQNFLNGLFAAEPTRRSVTQASVSWGDKGRWPKTDYHGVDDYSEIWWDPETTGPDEIRRQGAGVYQYVNGGKRYLYREMKREPPKVFDRDGAVAFYDEPPPEEKPPDYPPPKRSG